MVPGATQQCTGTYLMYVRNSIQVRCLPEVPNGDKGNLPSQVKRFSLGFRQCHNLFNPEEDPPVCPII